MAWELSKANTISPGATVRHWYWWGGPSKGPQQALVSPVGTVETFSNWVAVTKQGFRNLSDGCKYTVEVTCEDHSGSDASGVYDVWVRGFLS